MKEIEAECRLIHHMELEPKQIFKLTHTSKMMASVMRMVPNAYGMR